LGGLLDDWHFFTDTASCSSIVHIRRTENLTESANETNAIPIAGDAIQMVWAIWANGLRPKNLGKWEIS